MFVQKENSKNRLGTVRFEQKKDVTRQGHYAFDFHSEIIKRNIVICIANKEKVVGKANDNFKRSFPNIESEQSFVCLKVYNFCILYFYF